MAAPDRPAPPVNMKKPRQPASAKGLRLLIFGPDWRFEDAVQRMALEDKDRVLHESDLSHARQLVREWKPDILIISSEFVDARGMDELEQELHSTRQRPAIVISARMDRFDLAWKAWQKGADAVVFKPVFSPDELRSAIEEAQARAGVEPAAEERSSDEGPATGD